MSEKNMEKYQVYKTMNENLSKAMRSEFYYQAIFEYAIIEDRFSSVLRHAGVPCLNNIGQDISISQKLRKMRDNPAFIPLCSAANLLETDRKSLHLERGAGCFNSPHGKNPL